MGNSLRMNDKRYFRECAVYTSVFIAIVMSLCGMAAIVCRKKETVCIDFEMLDWKEREKKREENGNPKMTIESEKKKKNHNNWCALTEGKENERSGWTWRSCQKEEQEPCVVGLGNNWCRIREMWHRCTYTISSKAIDSVRVSHWRKKKEKKNAWEMEGWKRIDSKHARIPKSTLSVMCCFKKKKKKRWRGLRMRQGGGRKRSVTASSGRIYI